VKNFVQYDRTKHVEEERHVIKVKSNNGTICTPFVSSGNQHANVLTKGISGAHFSLLLVSWNGHSPT